MKDCPGVYVISDFEVIGVESVEQVLGGDDRLAVSVFSDDGGDFVSLVL